MRWKERVKEAYPIDRKSIFLKQSQRKTSFRHARSLYFQKQVLFIGGFIFTFFFRQHNAKLHLTASCWQLVPDSNDPKIEQDLLRQQSMLYTS